MRVRVLLGKYWPLLVVLIIGASIRFYGLLQNPISLYSDEVDIGYQVYSLIKTGCDYSGHCFPIQFHSFSDVQPPIQMYLIALVHLLGFSLDYSIRFTSAIFGLFGILITYFLIENLASEKIFNLKLKYLGLTCSSVLAILPWHLLFSRIGFALTILYFFTTLGLYFYTEFIIEHKKYQLLISCFFLGLTPMVYSTAKMAIFAYPVILLVISDSSKIIKNIKIVLVSLFVMFLPLSILILNGGVDSRFQYISIFTDPTVSTEVNYARQLDAGPNAAVGTSPTIFSKLFHNKPLWYLGKLSNNCFNLISTQFLFTKGDPNHRHSLENWGMVYRSLMPLLAIGIYFLVRFNHKRMLWLLGLLTLTAISTSAITRDGGDHASRSFMMIIPIAIASGIGFAYLLKTKKVLFYAFTLITLMESIFFLHNYWSTYPYDSQRSWSAGMKDVIQSSLKYSNQPIVISPKYENPLIFFLYYTQFPPKTFQELSKTNKIYIPLHDQYKLEGNRIGNTDFYIANLLNYEKRSDFSFPNAVYYLTRAEVDKTELYWAATNSAIIRLPSGEPLFYEIHF